MLEVVYIAFSHNQNSVRFEPRFGKRRQYPLERGQGCRLQCALVVNVMRTAILILQFYRRERSIIHWVFSVRRKFIK